MSAIIRPPVLLEASLVIERFPLDAPYERYDLRVRGDVRVGEKGWEVDDLEILQGGIHVTELTPEEKELCAQELWESYEVEVDGALPPAQRAALALRLGGADGISKGFSMLAAIVERHGWPAAKLLAGVMDDKDGLLFPQLLGVLEHKEAA